MVTMAKPLLGVPLLVVWIGVGAFKAGAACGVSSRSVYE
jgi:hypothetical protein